MVGEEVLYPSSLFLLRSRSSLRRSTSSSHNNKWSFTTNRHHKQPCIQACFSSHTSCNLELELFTSVDFFPTNQQTLECTLSLWNWEMNRKCLLNCRKLKEINSTPFGKGPLILETFIGTTFRQRKVCFARWPLMRWMMPIHWSNGIHLMWGHLVGKCALAFFP